MKSRTKGFSTAKLQFAALPFRRSAKRTEVMLVTSRRTGRWIIPKGWPMKRRAPHVAAAKEALEEAGVVGAVDAHSLGSYSYEKRLKNGRAIKCEVHVFPLDVKRQQKSWLEKGTREIRWFTPTEAAATVEEPQLRNLIRRLSRKL